MVVSGFFNRLYANGQTYSAPSSHETFIMSYDQNGAFRWFDKTQTNSGYTQFYFPQHCAVVNYQPVLDAFVVTGNLRYDNVELFDHGQLNTSSQNNVFVCHAIDHGGGTYFKTHNGNSREGTHSAHSAFEGLEFSEGTNNNFLVYPNPAKSSINIVLPNHTGKSTTLTLIDARGKKVATFELSTKEEQVQLPPLTKGIYYLRLNDTTLAAQKLVIE